jgi:hypothetical protein
MKPPLRFDFLLPVKVFYRYIPFALLVVSIGYGPHLVIDLNEVDIVGSILVIVDKWSPKSPLLVLGYVKVAPLYLVGFELIIRASFILCYSVEPLGYQ